MQSTTVHIRNCNKIAHLQLSDFNRLRWSIAAMRSNQALQDSLASTPADSLYLVDSNCLLNTDVNKLAARSHVILWDGLNSLIELWQARPLLKHRRDLVYLHVGHFMDVADAFPANSRPLFSAVANERLLAGKGSSIKVPAWIDLVSKAREHLRPIKNRQSAPIKHKLLQQGGKIVFCGVICPDRSVLDSFFRGTTSTGLRQSLVSLEGLQWQGRLAAVHEIVVRIYARIQQEKAATAADWACLYSVLNVIHRIGTLAQIDAKTPGLFVNEYGRTGHFDPYCACDYARNVYLDFGSTRGPDAVYPRSVDILLNHKPYKSFRFLDPRQRLQAYLDSNSEKEFWNTCKKHSSEAVASLAAVQA